MAADKFFTGMFSTALKGSEVITAVEFPLAKKSGYAKFPNPASLYAMVGVFVAQMADGSVRVAVTGAGAGVFRVPEMEAALAKNFSAKALDGIAVKAKGLNSDMHASAEYRAHLIASWPSGRSRRRSRARYQRLSSPDLFRRPICQLAQL